MKIKKFNEAIYLDIQNDTFTLDELDESVKIINFKDDDKDNFKINRRWGGKNFKFNGDDYSIYEFGGAYGGCGFVILLNEQLIYIVGIYEPHGCDLLIKKGLVTIYGHESIINLFIDDGTYNVIHTR